jgi:hypothetical protein
MLMTVAGSRSVLRPTSSKPMPRQTHRNQRALSLLIPSHMVMKPLERSNGKRSEQHSTLYVELWPIRNARE